MCANSGGSLNVRFVVDALVENDRRRAGATYTLHSLPIPTIDRLLIPLQAIGRTLAQDTRKREAELQRVRLVGVEHYPEMSAGPLPEDAARRRRIPLEIPADFYLDEFVSDTEPRLDRST